MGLPILPHLLRQMPSRIVDYSGTTSSLYMRQPQQSFSLGNRNFEFYLLPNNMSIFKSLFSFSWRRQYV